MREVQQIIDEFIVEAIRMQNEPASQERNERFHEYSDNLVSEISAHPLAELKTVILSRDANQEQRSNYIYTLPEEETRLLVWADTFCTSNLLEGAVLKQITDRLISSLDNSNNDHFSIDRDMLFDDLYCQGVKLGRASWRKNGSAKWDNKDVVLRTDSNPNIVCMLNEYQVILRELLGESFVQPYGLVYSPEGLVVACAEEFIEGRNDGIFSQVPIEKKLEAVYAGKILDLTKAPHCDMKPEHMVIEHGTNTIVFIDPNLVQMILQKGRYYNFDEGCDDLLKRTKEHMTRYINQGKQYMRMFCGNELYIERKLNLVN